MIELHQIWTLEDFWFEPICVYESTISPTRISGFTNERNNVKFFLFDLKYKSKIIPIYGIAPSTKSTTTFHSIRI